PAQRWRAAAARHRTCVTVRGRHPSSRRSHVPPRRQQRAQPTKGTRPSQRAPNGRNDRASVVDRVPREHDRGDGGRKNRRPRQPHGSSQHQPAVSGTRGTPTTRPDAMNRSSASPGQAGCSLLFLREATLLCWPTLTGIVCRALPLSIPRKRLRCPFLPTTNQDTAPNSGTHKMRSTHRSFPPAEVSLSTKAEKTAATIRTTSTIPTAATIVLSSPVSQANPVFVASAIRVFMTPPSIMYSFSYEG